MLVLLPASQAAAQAALGGQLNEGVHFKRFCISSEV
jgi:hypothetical protein